MWRGGYDADVAFEAQFSLVGVLPVLARVVLCIMPRAWQKRQVASRIGLWAHTAALQQHFEATESDQDEHTHLVAIQGSAAILERLAIPHPCRKAGPDVWRPFLALIVIAAGKSDIQAARVASEKSKVPIFTARTAGELFAAVSAEDMTSIEVESCARPHIGKWIRIQSIVRDISSGENNYYVMLGDLHDPIPFLTFSKDELGEHIETMKKGDRIAAVGIITRITPTGRDLDSCKIVDFSGENDTFRSK